MFGIIMALLTFFFYVICAGVVLAILIYLPLMIYVIPYALWVGFQNQVGKHLDKKKERFWRTVRNATKLYVSWITRKEPSF
ncbi:hypothetical protein [Paenibacillus sp. oral taxon 786]|uniref:hypothetical protein n=1 Tax=Paenibacillus sp. oral taxon 786 TaxID=652715 RepID=UPI0003194C80|nr:hypothetical protein [Paenibacillus sp. oral taxon 786]